MLEIYACGLVSVRAMAMALLGLCLLAALRALIDDERGASFRLGRVRIGPSRAAEDGIGRIT